MRYPFSTAEELLAQCKEHGLSISSLMLANEQAWRSESDIRSGLLALWEVMQACIDRAAGARASCRVGSGQTPRRASLSPVEEPGDSLGDESLNTMDWVTLYALAVNEENAVGGRIVTAPTNGAAGIIPAVLKYYLHHCKGASDDDVCRFLLTAGAIGISTRSMRRFRAPRWGVRERWLCLLHGSWRFGGCIGAHPNRSRTRRRSPWNTILA